MELYLHIGMNKVASTAIQEFFSGHRERLLRDHSVLWPATGAGHGGKGGSSHYAISEALGFTNDPQFFALDNARIGALITDLRAEIVAAKPRVTVLSSEFFVLRRDPVRVKLFFGRYTPRIVIYVRRHDAWLTSLYAQAIKSVVSPRWGRSFESFLEFQRQRRGQFLSFLDLVNAWAAVFGDENILLRPCGEDLPPSEVIADLLSVLGVGPGRDLPLPQVRSNPSPSANALSIIDLIQRSDLPERQRRRIVASILASDDRALPRFEASPATRNAVLAENLEPYRILSERFRGGRPLFELGPVDPDGSWGHSPLPRPERTDAIARSVSAQLSRSDMLRIFG